MQLERDACYASNPYSCETISCQAISSHFLNESFSNGHRILIKGTHVRGSLVTTLMTDPWTELSSSGESWYETTEAKISFKLDDNYYFKPSDQMALKNVWPLGIPYHMDFTTPTIRTQRENHTR